VRSLRYRTIMRILSTAVLIAQAFAERLTIVTRDKRFGDYGVALLSA
jgi:PIN domain nuclease of toxin-antitoxin system